MTSSVNPNNRIEFLLHLCQLSNDNRKGYRVDYVNGHFHGGYIFSSDRDLFTDVLNHIRKEFQEKQETSLWKFDSKCKYLSDSNYSNRIIRLNLTPADRTYWVFISPYSAEETYTACLHYVTPDVN